MESRDLSFDLSPAEQKLVRAREIADDPTAPYDAWREAYLLVQHHDIWQRRWEEVGPCATSTDDSADGGYPGDIARRRPGVTGSPGRGTKDPPEG